MNGDVEKLQRFLSYLQQDPCNSALLADAFDAALGAADLPLAKTLLARLASADPEASGNRGRAGLLAMHERRFDDAVSDFEAMQTVEDSPELRFNMAWSLAMLGRKSEAEAMLDEQCVTQLASAAMLRVQLLHELGDFDGAAELAHALQGLHGRDPGFAAAVSVLALDVEDLELARSSAVAGGDHPDAIATCGMLLLNDASPERALDAFDRALAIRSHHPRAWVGRGLAKLVRLDAASAAADLDKGAEQFGDHIGSWLAAGWAYCVSGDHLAARERFERALAIDENFAESHGSIAAIDALTGRRHEARRGIAITLRLDRNCFSAALAQVLLLQDEPQKAQAIIARALSEPLNASGLTITGYLAGLAKPTIH